MIPHSKCIEEAAGRLERRHHEERRHRAASRRHAVPDRRHVARRLRHREVRRVQGLAGAAETSTSLKKPRQEGRSGYTKLHNYNALDNSALHILDLLS